MQIPAYLAQRQLGMDPGTPEASGGLRVTPQPTASPGAFTAGAQGIQAAGRAVREVGEVLQLYANRQAYAEEKIAVEKSTQTFLQRYDQAEQELHQQALQPPAEGEEGGLSLLAPRARGDRALEIGRDLMADVGQRLAPRQRSLFEAEANRYLTARVRSVRDRAQSEFLADAQQTIEASVDYHTGQALNAPDRVQAQLHLSTLQRVLEEGVQTGTITPAKRQQLVAKSSEMVLTNAAQVALRSDPGQAVQDLQALMSGKPAVLDPLNDAPRALLPKLYDDALQELSKQVTLRTHAATQARQTLAEKQKIVASQYRSQIYKPGITIADLVGLVEPINASRRQQELGEEDHASLLKDTQALMDKLREDAYKDRDVPAIAQAAGIKVELAQTPGELALAREWVLAQTPTLSTATTQRLLGRIETRADKSAYSNRDAYKEGRQTILGAAMPGGIVPATLDSLDDATKVKLATALDIYAEQMQRIYEQQGTVQGDSQARQQARTLRDLYFPKDEANERYLPGLPREMQPPAVQTYEDALQVLSGMEIPQTLKRQYYLKLKASPLPRRGGAPQQYSRPAGPPERRGQQPR